MKTQALLAGIVIAVLNGLAFLPDLRTYSTYLSAAAAVAALWLVARSLVHRPPEPTGATTTATPAAPPPPAPPPAPGRREEEAVTTLLGIFQEKGRLIDFLMDDITAYSDAQVGAAARVVHQGLKPALQEHFRIVPVAPEDEGAPVTVPADAAAGHYRLSGKLSGEGPFSGTLVHRGWKAEAVTLPRLITGEGEPLPPLAPAQVEVR